MANNQTNAGPSKQNNDNVEETIFQTAVQSVDSLLNPFYENVIQSENRLLLLQEERDSYFMEWEDILRGHRRSYDRLHDMIQAPNYNREEFTCLLESRVTSQRRIEELKQNVIDLEEQIRYFSLPSAEEVIQLRQNAKAQEEIIIPVQPSTAFVMDALVFKNLSWSLDEQDARRRISHDVNLPYPRAWNYHKDKNSNSFTGISFANYETAEEARLVYEYFNNSEHMIEERVVKVEYKIQKLAAEDGNSRRSNSTPENDLGVLGSNLRTAGSTQMDQEVLAPHQTIYGIASGAQTHIRHIPQQQNNNSNTAQSSSTLSGAANPFVMSSPSNQNNVQSYQRQSQQTGFQQTNIGNMGQTSSRTSPEEYWLGRRFTPLFAQDSAQHPSPNTSVAIHQQASISNNGQTTPHQPSPTASNPQNFPELNTNMDTIRAPFQSIRALAATPLLNPPSMPRIPGTSVPSPLRNGKEREDNTNFGIIGQERGCKKL